MAGSEAVLNAARSSAARAADMAFAVSRKAETEATWSGLRADAGDSFAGVDEYDRFISA